MPVRGSCYEFVALSDVSAADPAVATHRIGVGNRPQQRRVRSPRKRWEHRQSWKDNGKHEVGKQDGLKNQADSTIRPRSLSTPQTAARGCGLATQRRADIPCSAIARSMCGQGADCCLVPPVFIARWSRYAADSHRRAAERVSARPLPTPTADHQPCFLPTNIRDRFRFIWFTKRASTPGAMRRMNLRVTGSERMDSRASASRY